MMMRTILSALAALALLGGAHPAAAGAVPYVGERVVLAGNYCPINWLPMEGQVLAVTDFPALYSLIGANYGGNGVTTFALPNAKPIVTANGGPDGINNVVVTQCIAVFGEFPQVP